MADIFVKRVRSDIVDEMLYTLKQIKSLVKYGNLQPNDLLSRDKKKWIPVSEMKAFEPGIVARLKESLANVKDRHDKRITAPVDEAIKKHPWMKGTILEDWAKNYARKKYWETVRQAIKDISNSFLEFSENMAEWKKLEKDREEDDT